MPRHLYPPEHQADMHFVYGYCNGNSMEAVREYRRRFPHRTVPHNQTFITESEGVKSAEAVEEEARAERKRRQRQAQEEFRLKLLKAKDKEDKPEAPRNSSGFDKLLLEIPSQEIMIEQAGSTDEHKRKSPAPEGSCKKRVLNRLDIVQNK